MTQKTKIKPNLALTETFAGAKGALAETYRKQYIIEQKGYFQVASHVYSWLGPSNYAAYTYALDVVDFLEEKGLLKRNVKKTANRVTEAYKYYRQMAIEKSNRGRDNEASEGDTRVLWDNLCERVYRRVEKHVNILYWAVNSYLKKMKTKGDVELYSKLFTAHMLFDLAYQRYKTFFVVMGDTYCNGRNFEDLFPEFNPDPMHGWWSKLEDLLIPADIIPNFNEDKNTHDAFDVVALKFNDPTILNEAASEALSYDPVFAEKSKKIREDWVNEQKQIIKNAERE